MKAIIDGDLVVGTLHGDGIGLDVPAALAGIALHRLRVRDGCVIDASAITTWWVDDMGRRHIGEAPGLQRVACGIGDPLVRDPAGAWRVSTQVEKLAPAVKAEFTRRVAAVLGDKRASIISYAIRLSGLVSIGLARGQAIEQSLSAEQQADVALIWAIDDWESAMIEVREALIAAGDASYTSDAHWPAAPAGVTAAWLAGF